MQQPHMEEEMEIDLKELFFELLAHWKMIVLSAILTGVIAMLVSIFLITPKYQSTYGLYVLTKSSETTSLSDLQTGSNLTNDYMVVTVSRPVLDQVIENLDLDMGYAGLKGMISLNNPSNSRIIEITVTDTDQDRAEAIANEVAQVVSEFIADKMDQIPPTTIEYGSADGKPVSPNKMKNTALGIVLGAFLAMAIVVISYLLNDTIMTAEDVEKKLGMVVLASLPLEEEEGRKKNSKKKKSNKKKNA